MNDIDDIYVGPNTLEHFAKKYLGVPNDIKGIGDGTVTGAIKDINDSFSKLATKGMCRKKALFFGDSLTVGRISQSEGYVTSSYPYPDVFCELAGITDFLNVAVGGATAVNDNPNSWMAQYNRVDSISNYDYIFFMFGTNDFLSNKIIGNRYDPSLGDHTFIKDAMQTLNIICTQCKNSKIFCLLPPYEQTKENNFSLTLQDYRNAMNNVANMFNIPVIDMSQIGFNDNNASYLMSDEVHFNDISYRKMGVDLFNSVMNSSVVAPDMIGTYQFPTGFNVLDDSFFDYETITAQPLYDGKYIDVNGVIESKKEVITSSNIPLMLRFNTVNSQNLRSMDVEINKQTFKVLLNPGTDFITLYFTGKGGASKIKFSADKTVRISNIYFGVATPFPHV